MTSYDTTHLERQLSSLFRAEAQDAHLPLGTWQEIAPKMGEPDRRSLLGLIRDAMRIPRAEKMWRNPMRVRYVAPAATVMLAIIIALLFILLVNDTDDDNSPVPAVSPTVPSGPTEPAPTPDLAATVERAGLDATATAEAMPTAAPTVEAESTATAISQPVATTTAPELSPGGRPLHTLGLQYLAETFVFDGEHVWASAGDWLSPDVKKLDLEGNVVGSFRGGREASYGVVFAHDSIWTLDIGESQVRRLGLDGTERFRTSLPTLGLGRVIDEDGVWFSTHNGSSLTHVDLEGQIGRTVSLDQRTVQLMKHDSQVFALNEEGLWSVDLETGSMERVVGGLRLRDVLPEADATADSVVFLDGIPDNAALVTATAFVFGFEADDKRYVAAINRTTDAIALVPVELPEAQGWPKFRFATDGESFWVNHTSADGGAVSRFTVDGTVLATEFVGGEYQPRAMRLVGDELWVGRADGKLVRIPTDG